ncbi:MAG TPA: hypothetical protein VFW75_14905, partial [Acetobacteraceae bacterium]|nr:hypothetical protein [Acetobacteraceae bacterium]
IVSSGDYSYGMYLYGYPLQQAVASVGPATHHWAINVGIALPAAWLVAYCSWHYVERRALALRSHLPALEARIVRWVSDRRQVLVAGASGVAQQREIIDSILLAGVCAAGVAGVLLLVSVHEVLGILSIVLACFAVRVSLLRLRGV